MKLGYSIYLLLVTIVPAFADTTRTIGVSSSSGKTLYLYAANGGIWNNSNAAALTLALDPSVSLTPQTYATLEANAALTMYNVPDQWDGAIFAVDTPVVHTGPINAAYIYFNFSSSIGTDDTTYKIGDYMDPGVTPGQGFTVSPYNNQDLGTPPTGNCTELSYPPSMTPYETQYCDPVLISFTINFTD